MKLLITLMIAVGALNMVVNIVRYHRFLLSCQDVLSSGKKNDRLWMVLAEILLVFFLFGYVFVGFSSSPDLMMASILFFGSIFVTIVIANSLTIYVFPHWRTPLMTRQSLLDDSFQSIRVLMIFRCSISFPPFGFPLFTAMI